MLTTAGQTARRKCSYDPRRAKRAGRPTAGFIGATGESRTKVRTEDSGEYRALFVRIAEAVKADNRFDAVDAADDRFDFAIDLERNVSDRQHQLGQRVAGLPRSGGTRRGGRGRAGEHLPPKRRNCWPPSVAKPRG